MIKKIIQTILGGANTLKGRRVKDGAGVPTVLLHPDSDFLRGQSAAEPKKIERKVFRIGRRASSQINYPNENGPDLLLFERAPYTLSRLHCQIEIDGDSVFLRDMGSRVGTKLGGRRLLAKKGETVAVEVPKGTHKLVLGGRESPFRFHLEVL